MRGLPRLYVVGRSLCGERGLKYLCHLTGLLCLLSLPMWGEMCTSLAKTKPVRSLPMRGARIEIPCIPWCRCSEVVAPRARSVDLKYAEAVKRPSQGMYRDGRWCISGVIPYLTAIGGRYAVQYSKKRDD